MTTSLTDTAAWREFCLAAADDLALLDADDLDNVGVRVVGGKRMREARYARITSDLETLFGSLGGLRVLEIGGGYGGQAAHLIEHGCDVSIIDLPEPRKLQDAYLAARGMKLMPCRNGGYDLAVSNYALSEMVRPVQVDHARIMARRSPLRGYIRWNGWTTNELHLDELVALLPESFVSVDRDDDRNRVITWGALSPWERT